MKKTIITVVGKDTIGIIAKVCTYLAENGINILDISQTIVQDYFNMMMIVDTSKTEKPFGDMVDEMMALGEEYAGLSGYYPKAKPVTISWILSVQQLSGIYSPFTVEGNYNRAMTAYNIPHTICHELSHLRGFMQEEEVNFIAFLACIGFGKQDFEF